MKKVDFTLLQYKSEFKNGPITSYFNSVVSRMNDEVKATIDEEVKKIADERYKDIPKYRYEHNWVSGEIALWDMLTANGVNEILAAKLAANFPNPMRFDPGIIIKSIDFRKRFDDGVKSGKKALDILVELAELDLNNSFSPDEYGKNRKFKEYAEKESAKYS